MLKLIFRNFLILLIIFLLAAIFNGCGKPPLPPVITGIISGQAADPIESSAKDITGYTPIADAKVTIVDAEGVTHTTYTDSEGYYHFDNLSVKANTIINIIKELPDGGKKVYKDIIPLAVSSEENYDAGIADAESTALALVVEVLIELGQSQENVDLNEITSSDGFDELKENVQQAQQDNQDINTDNQINTQVEEIADNIVNPPTPEPTPTPTYTVTFNSQGGSAVSSQTVNHGGLVSKPTDPTKAGYTFGGWYKESGCTTAWVFASDTVTSAVTLYAKWTIKTYTVTFNSQGGSAVSSQTVNHGGLVSKPTDPTKAGYTFGGWYKEAGCTTAWDFDTDTVTSNVTLYAQWNINTYTVTFDKNGGNTEADPTTKTATHGGNVGTLPTAPTRTGCTFASWNTEAGGGGTEFTAATVVTASITVYAQWTCTVTFNSQGGSAVDSQNVNHGGLVSKPTDPTKAGYTFGGWYKEAGCTTAWDFDTDTVTSNVTLYAQWNINTYTVTFDKDDAGATGTMAAQTIASGSSANLTACGFSKTGWKFDGWAETSGGDVVYADEASYPMGTSDVTLYAQWTPPEVYALRDIGPAGGRIFYDDEADGVDDIAGARYLEAAPSDQSTGIVWAITDFQSTAVTGTLLTIGSGSANTDKIIVQNGAGSTYAAGIARAYGGGGYSDWFLPSKGELYKMWVNLKKGTDENSVTYTPVGGFAGSGYWSSSEDDASSAWVQFFGNGRPGVSNKTNNGWVRAVRAF